MSLSIYFGTLCIGWKKCERVRSERKKLVGNVKVKIVFFFQKDSGLQ